MGQDTNKPTASNNEMKNTIGVSGKTRNGMCVWRQSVQHDYSYILHIEEINNYTQFQLYSIEIVAQQMPCSFRMCLRKLHTFFCRFFLLHAHTQFFFYVENVLQFFFCVVRACGGHRSSE